MNQRRLADEARLIPASVQVSEHAPPSLAGNIAFDKAEEAEQLEKEMQGLRKEIEELELALKDAAAEDKERLQATLEACRRRLQAREGDEGTKDGTWRRPSATSRSSSVFLGRD
jgi:molecular chaperone GrpE (heat shock protein)